MIENLKPLGVNVPQLKVMVLHDMAYSMQTVELFKHLLSFINDGGTLHLDWMLSDEDDWLNQ